MNTEQHFKARIIMFICGIAAMTFGIALSCKANLGTSPISSVPWVLSLCTPFSVGFLTIAMNLLFCCRTAAFTACFLLARTDGAGNSYHSFRQQHRFFYVGFAGLQSGYAS